MGSPHEETSSESHSFGDERLLWKNEVKTGIINRRVIETQIVTTQRVIKNNYTIRLEDIIDIVVTNQQRISNAQYVGFRPKYSYTSFGTSTSRSKTIGDVIFFHNNGETDFCQIENPQNVSRIVKAARKKILAQLKEMQKAEKARTKKGIICKNCGKSNADKSLFCNMCGTSLNSKTTTTATTNNNKNKIHSEFEDVDFETYELLSEGIRIHYPSDWIVLEDQLESPTIAAFLSPLEDQSDNYREPLVILKFAYEKNFELDEYIENEFKDFHKDSNIKIIQSEQITLSSKTAHKMVFREGDVIRYGAITLEKNITGKGMTSFWIFATIKEQKYEKFLPLVNKMINTFEII